MLVILGGLPATGKTSIAGELATMTGAVHLRIDTIEEAILSSGQWQSELGPIGYLIAYDLATDNLRIGNIVIADCVNPLGITRDAWRAVATKCGAGYLEVEIICSNKAMHRARVESRPAGSRAGTWAEVLKREYEPWTSPRMIQIDTATASITECTEQIFEHLAALTSAKTVRLESKSR